jgi:hypothetical protein
MFGWGLSVVGAATPRFGSEDTLAPVGRARWYHRLLTLDGARAAGWSEGAAGELGWHTAGVDFYAYHPIWRIYGGPRRIRGARMAAADLVAVHFDNLISTAAITQVWSRIIGGTVVGVDWAAARGDVRSARQVIGVGLHAIQDFYSHSTWIDDPARRDLSWLQAQADPHPELLNGLSTGGFGPDGEHCRHLHGETDFTARSFARIPAMLAAPLLDVVRNRRPIPAGPGATGPNQGPPPGLRYAPAPGINLDSRWQARIGARTRGLDGLDGDAAFDLASGLAVRETRLWLEALDQRFGTGAATEAFWSRVRSDPGGDWTEAFNDPARLAYQFIAAGDYPPRASDTDAASAWFVRVMIGSDQPGRAALFTTTPTRRPLGQVTIGQAGVVGPLDSPDDPIEVVLPTPGLEVQVQAFRRAPAPELRPVSKLVVRTRRS